MSRKSRRDTSGFPCAHCKRPVPGESFGTRHRNHCPHCLWSLHVDEEPGDRRCACRSPMAPVALEVRTGGEWAIIHRCTGCGVLKTNRTAGDDHAGALLSLALKPLASPPFPLDALGGGW